MFLVYVLLAHLAFIIVLPMLVFHPKLRSGFFQRLASTKVNPLQTTQPVIWFHGASAGDLMAIRPMVVQLKDQLPHVCVVLSTITNSGIAMATKMQQQLVYHSQTEKAAKQTMIEAVFYLPFDLPWCLNRLLSKVRPDILVLEYAEIWPALIRAAKQRQARIMLTNGRFNENLLKRYRFFYRLIGNPLHKLDLMCMRDQTEAEHALAIGAAPKQIRVTGNTKFDLLGLGQTKVVNGEKVAVSALSQALAIQSDDLIWIAGSTHDGEEGIILSVFQNLLVAFPNLRLVIAPRYPFRAQKVLSIAKQRGLQGSLRTKGVSNKDQVVILDTVGELSQAYQLADVVFLGGSFVERGGQNILEPAQCKKAVLFGPHMENFQDSIRVLVGRGGIQVLDQKSLQQTLHDLLANPHELVKLGELAQEAVGSVRGASQANVEAICELLAERQNHVNDD